MKLNNEDKLLSISLISLLVLVISFSIYFSGNFSYWNFGDRDLLRAENLLSEFQIYGAELDKQMGKRVPGGFMSYYLWVLIQFTENINLIYLTSYSLYLLVLCYLCSSVAKDVNFIAGLFSGLILFTATKVYWQLSMMLNPFFGFPFCLAAYAFFYRFISTKNTKFIIFSYIFCAIAAQFHLSFISLIIPFFLITTRLRLIHFFKNFYFLIIILCIIYFPYILDNFIYFENFDSTKKILLNEDLDILNIKYGFAYWLKTIYNLQSFAQISPNTTIHLPLTAILLGIVAYCIAKKKVNLNPIYQKVIFFLKLNAELAIILTLVISLGWFFTYGTFQFGLPIRYFLVFSPIYALISGLSFYTIYLSIKESRKIFKYIGLIVIFLFFSSRLLSVVYLNYNKLEVFKHHSYNKKKDAVNLLVDELNFSKNDLLTKSAFSENLNNELIFRPFAFRFFIENYNFKNINNEYSADKGCALLVYPVLKNKENLKNKVQKLIYNYDKIKIKKVLDIKNFTLINYETLNGSCLKNFDNDYILTNEENYSKRQLLNKKIGYSKTYYNDNKIHLFKKIKLPNTNHFLDVYFEFTINENDTLITLHSKKFRNYDTQIQGGFWEEVLIKDPVLIFRNVLNNKIINKKLINGTIGENLKTPWTIKINNLENNIYDLTLVGTIMRKEYDWQRTDIAAKTWVLKNIIKEEIDITLDSKFEIK